MQEQTVTEHPSFGIISLSRVTCSHGVPFVGSQIKCSEYIQLVIQKAQKIRNIDNHFYGKEQLLVLRLSPNQFSELITHMNTSGTPCTLERVSGQRMPDPPYESEIENLRQEIREIDTETKNLFVDLQHLIQNSNIPVKTKTQFLVQVSSIYDKVKENLPFRVQQAFETIDKGITEAKSVIDAFYTNLLVRTGLRTLQEEQKVAIDFEKKGV